MQGADELMRRRSGIVEHPFGTLKCRAGYRHFLVRGFNKVRGEWSLMALCYNFTRLLNILGIERFLACMAKAFQWPATAILNLIQIALDAIWTPAGPWPQRTAHCRPDGKFLPSLDGATSIPM
jgi:hypothetical protein